MKAIVNLLGIVAMFFATPTSLFATSYELDKKESTLKWFGEKVTGKHHGTISFEKGELELTENEIMNGDFQVNMGSIVCEDIENENFNKRLVDHLKSEDFFSTENFPVSSLSFNETQHVEGDLYRFKGELTIKGVTHPLSFDANVDMNAETVTAKGTLKVDRTKYDIRYGSGKFFQNLGDNMIDDHFTLEFEIVAKNSEKSTTSNQ